MPGQFSRLPHLKHLGELHFRRFVLPEHEPDPHPLQVLLLLTTLNGIGVSVGRFEVMFCMGLYGTRFAGDEEVDVPGPFIGTGTLKVKGMFSA